MILLKTMRMVALVGLLVPIASQSMETVYSISRRMIGSDSTNTGSTASKPLVTRRATASSRSSAGHFDRNRSSASKISLSREELLLAAKMVAISASVPLLTAAALWVSGSYLGRPVKFSIPKIFGLSGVGALLGLGYFGYVVSRDAERVKKENDPLRSIMQSDDVEQFNKVELLDYHSIGEANLDPRLVTQAAKAGAVKIFDRLVEVGMKPTKEDYRLLDEALVADLQAKEDPANKTFNAQTWSLK